MGGDGGLRTLAATIIGFYLGYTLGKAALIMLGSAAAIYVLYKYIQMIDQQKKKIREWRIENRNGGP
jgi:hypothetical protein